MMFSWPYFLAENLSHCIQSSLVGAPSPEPLNPCGYLKIYTLYSRFFSERWCVIYSRQWLLNRHCNQLKCLRANIGSVCMLLRREEEAKKKYLVQSPNELKKITSQPVQCIKKHLAKVSSKILELSFWNLATIHSGEKLHAVLLDCKNTQDGILKKVTLP